MIHHRLRGGNAYTARGAASFLAETFNRVHAAGATGPLTLRADSGFYSGKVTAACRKNQVRFSITAKTNPAIRKAIDAIDEKAWEPIPYWLDNGAQVGETTYRPFGEKAPLVRLIVARVRPTPGSRLALFTEWSYHALITDREGDTIELEADHRRHAVVEDAIRDLKYGVGLNHFPSGKFAANAAWLAVAVMAHNLARWTSRIGLGESLIETPTLRRRYLRAPGASPARPAGAPCTCPPVGPGPSNFTRRSNGSAPLCCSPERHVMTAQRASPGARTRAPPTSAGPATPRHSRPWRPETRLPAHNPLNDAPRAFRAIGRGRSVDQG